MFFYELVAYFTNIIFNCVRLEGGGPPIILAKKVGGPLRVNVSHVKYTKCT